MAIRMRIGNEEKFDASKMVPGEWAVSTDTKYVRMCFAPGVCIRIATYDSFEGDMAELQAILEECRTIEEAVKAIQAQIGQEVEVITTLSKNAQNAANMAAQNVIEAATSATDASASATVATQKANNAKASADAASASSAQAETHAQSAERSAQAALESANVVNEKVAEASQSAVSASGQADRSKTNADNAENSALEAESYAHGDTNIREGEETDNAKYYCQSSHEYRNESEEFASKANDALEQITKKVNLAEFSVDDNGNLLYTDNAPYNFTIDENGNLLWEVA